MFLTKLILAFLLCGNVLGGVIPRRDTTQADSSSVSPSPAVVPVATAGNVAAVQSVIANEDTRLVFQNPDNSIGVLAVSGPFTTGTLFSDAVLVPADEVQPNTLIAAVALGEDFNEMHVYFISPSNTLSEYIWSATAGVWRGGPSCPDCIDVNEFVVQPGNRVLYAMINEDAIGSIAKLRVGFVSAGAPTGLSEAVFDAVNGWKLGQMIS